MTHATIERTPLLRAVRLDADPCASVLRLDATDGALALTQTIPAAVDGGWRRAVAARPLAALVADLPDGPPTLAAVAAASGATLALGAEDIGAILPALDHDAFPAGPEAGPRCTPPLDAPELAAAPRYDAAIPPDWAVRVTINRAHLRRAARLARRVIAAEDPSLLLLPGPTGLRVVARDPDSDASLVAPLPAACETVVGDFPPIVLGAQSLSDPLRLSPGRSITLAWRATNEAVTIGGTDIPDCRDRLWVVMPQHNPQDIERELRRRPAA